MWFTGQIGEAVAQVQSTGKVLVVFGKGTFIDQSILTISHFCAILRTRNIFASNIVSSVGVPGFTEKSKAVRQTKNIPNSDYFDVFVNFEKEQTKFQYMSIKCLLI